MLVFKFAISLFNDTSFSDFLVKFHYSIHVDVKSIFLIFVNASIAVGELVAKRALSKGIKHVVFDRGGNLYHGRVKALADAAREAGLKF